MKKRFCLGDLVTRTGEQESGRSADSRIIQENWHVCSLMTTKMSGCSSSIVSLDLTEFAVHETPSLPQGRFSMDSITCNQILFFFLFCNCYLQARIQDFEMGGEFL